MSQMDVLCDTNGELENSKCVKDEYTEDEVQQVNLLDLSDDVLLCIFQYCSPRDLKALGFTCPRLATLICDHTLWCHVDTRTQPCGEDRLLWYTWMFNSGTTGLLVNGFAREAVIEEEEKREKAKNPEPSTSTDPRLNTETKTSQDEELKLVDGKTFGDGKTANPPPSHAGCPSSPGRLAQTYRRIDCRDQGTSMRVVERYDSAFEPRTSADHSPPMTISRTILYRLKDQCKNLTWLALDYCNIDCQKTLISAFPPTLKKLSLVGTRVYNQPVDKTFLYRLNDYLPHLEEMDVSLCDWLSPSGLLPLSRLERLDMLSARNCGLLSEFVAYASLATRYGFLKLRVLDLRNSPLADSEVSSFGWLPSLEELYLSAEDEKNGPDYVPQTKVVDDWEINEPEYFAQLKIEIQDQETETENAEPTDASKEAPKGRPSYEIYETAPESEPGVSVFTITVNNNRPRLGNFLALLGAGEDDEDRIAQRALDEQLIMLHHEERLAEQARYCRYLHRAEIARRMAESNRKQKTKDDRAEERRNAEASGSSAADGNSGTNPSGSSDLSNSVSRVKKRCNENDDSRVWPVRKRRYDDPISLARRARSEAKLQRRLLNRRGRVEEIRPTVVINLMHNVTDPSCSYHRDQDQEPDHPLDEPMEDQDCDTNDRPSSLNDQPSCSNGDQPSCSNGDQPSCSNGDQPSCSNGDQPSGVKDNQPSCSKDDKPSCSMDYQPSCSKDDQASGSKDDQPSCSMDYQPSCSKDDQASGSKHDQPSCSKYNKPICSMDYQPSCSKDEQASGSKDDQPSCSKDNQPSCSKDDQPSCSNDDQSYFSEDDQSNWAEVDESSNSPKNDEPSTSKQNHDRSFEATARHCISLLRNEDKFNRNRSRSQNGSRNQPSTSRQADADEPIPPHLDFFAHRPVVIDSDDNRDNPPEERAFRGVRPRRNYQILVENERQRANPNNQRLPYMIRNIFFAPTSEINPRSLVTDMAIRHFGREDHEDIVHIGPNGVILRGRANENRGRPKKSKLRKLVCTGYNGITNSSLSHLASAAPNLEFIDFSGTRVNEAGVNRFKLRRPNCEVVFGKANKENKKE